MFNDGLFHINDCHFVPFDHVNLLERDDRNQLIKKGCLYGTVFQLYFDFYNLKENDFIFLIYKLFRFNNEQIAYFILYLQTVLLNPYEPYDCKQHFLKINIPINHVVHAYISIFTLLLKDVSFFSHKQILVSNAMLKFGILDESVSDDLLIWATQFPNVLVFICYYDLKKKQSHIVCDDVFADLSNLDEKEHQKSVYVLFGPNKMFHINIQPIVLKKPFLMSYVHQCMIFLKSCYNKMTSFIS
jgi:hypothetical protein